ncbi:MAG TPA: hypothetical protein V6C72_03975, partial [Chroococcales cyanobacterium]
MAFLQTKSVARARAIFIRSFFTGSIFTGSLVSFATVLIATGLATLAMQDVNAQERSRSGSREVAEISPGANAGDGDESEAKPMSDRSSDGFFSEADFINKAPVDKKGHAKAPETTVAKVQTKVFVNVPHNTRAVNLLTAYPYPMMPPKAVMPKLLPFRGADLKQRLLASGYSNKISESIERPYPNSGWRWQYCYQAAYRRSSMSTPHIMSEMYRWADDMVPFIVPEILQSNQAERDRFKRYKAAIQEYDESRQDLETE